MREVDQSGANRPPLEVQEENREGRAEAAAIASPKLAVSGLTKVFGSSAAAAVELIREGVSVDEVRTRTDCVVAVSDVSFEVAAGETFVIMGLSGSGKSTLLRCINRLVEPTSGQIAIDGADVTGLEGRELRELRREKVSMVFQSFALFPHKTVLDNVAYPLKIRGVPRPDSRTRAEEALSVVGLNGWGARYPRELSGGMQQRVGLARALATDPDILLMDEPFSALDPLLRTEMQDELLRLQDSVRKTIVFVSHDIDEAVRLGSRIAIMDKGRILQIDAPEALISRPSGGHVARFVRNVDPTQVLTAGTIATPAVGLSFTESPETALATLEGAQSPYAFVLDDDHRPVAVVTAAALRRVCAENADLRAAGVEFQAVNSSAPIATAFEYLAAGLPVAVVDRGGHLVGSLVAEAMMEILARRRPDAGAS
jgi:glycine betaine/proline transport system ATP-binding protein